MFDDRAQRGTLLARILDGPGAAEEHHGSVVGRVVHRRARQHQAIEQRHGEAGGRARGQRAQCSPGGRAVHVDHVCSTSVQGGHDKRLPVRVDDAEVREQSLIQDRVDQRPLVASAFALAPQAHAVGGRRRGRGAGRGGDLPVA